MKAHFQVALSDYAKRFEDLRQLRNISIHPSLVSYHLTRDSSTGTRHALGIPDTTEFLGMIGAEFPGRDKIQALFKRGLLEDKPLGTDTFTMLGQTPICNYFLDLAKQFVTEYMVGWQDETFSLRLKQYLTQATFE